MNGLAIHLLFYMWEKLMNTIQKNQILMMNEQRKAGMLYAKLNRA